MAIPRYIYKSRHGIYFFRLVVPRVLLESLPERTVVRCSLHTRKWLEATLPARPLVDRYVDLFQLASAMVSPEEPTIADLLAKVHQGELRDLTASQTVVLPDGRQHSYTIKTDSASPQAIDAFERLEAKKQSELAAFVARYEKKPVDVREAMRL
ncbi:MAG: hypothetical protein RIS90_1802 [Pseudomonadota bacterium]|jgi:hypothetical protein